MSQVLAIDVGGTKVASGVIDANGEVSNKSQIQTIESTSEPLYPRLLEMAKNTLQKYSGAIELNFLTNVGLFINVSYYLENLV